MNNCQVCKKHKTLDGLPGGVIYENENIFVAHFPQIENEPAHRGHVIIEMKRHITQLNEMTEEEAEEFGRWTRLIAIAQHEALKAEHVYQVRIGDVTPHLHFHLVPRYKNAPRDSWGPLHFRWGEGPKASAQEMKEISELLRTFLRKNSR